MNPNDELHIPLTEADAEALEAGTFVILSGPTKRAVEAAIAAAVQAERDKHLALVASTEALCSAVWGLDIAKDDSMAGIGFEDWNALSIWLRGADDALAASKKALSNE